MADDHRARAHVRVTGRVQGVGFRYYTAAEAQRRRLTGWVRNLDSGGVEAVFQGPRASVEDLVRWCSEGPPGAYVSQARVTWDEPTEDLPDFAIRPTVNE